MYANTEDTDESAYISPEPLLLAGLEVIKLEYSLMLKIKRNDWLLAATCFILSLRMN